VEFYLVHSGYDLDTRIRGELLEEWYTEVRNADSLHLAYT
jgi:hypothetical protein